jgi:Uma2 family endonuclease
MIAITRPDWHFHLMTSLLELPEIRRQVYPVPVDVYHRLTDGLKTELLRGTIIQKVSKSPIHRKFVEKLRRILTAQVEPQWLVFQEAPLTTHDSEPEPDLMIVVGPLECYDAEHPQTAELAIETAISSLAIDRAKASIYAEAGVKEYWIFCPEQRCVEVYRKPLNGEYVERINATTPAVLESTALPAVRINLAELLA